MDVTTRLGKRLAELDRSAAWLARQVDVHRVTAARWANGEMRICEEHLAAVAAAVGLSVADLSHDYRR